MLSFLTGRSTQQHTDDNHALDNLVYERQSQETLGIIVLQLAVLTGKRTISAELSLRQLTHNHHRTDVGNNIQYSLDRACFTPSDGRSDRSPPTHRWGCLSEKLHFPTSRSAKFPQFGSGILTAIGDPHCR